MIFAENRHYGAPWRCLPGLGRSRLACVVGFLALTFLAGCQAETAEAEDGLWIPVALEDEGDDLLDGRDVIQRVVDFMDSRQEMMAEAFVTYEAVQDSGQKVHFDLLQRVAVRKPDKLYWETLRDDATVDTARFSDGHFILFKQPENVWGRIDRQGTVAEIVDFLALEYKLYVPFRDLLGGELAELWLSDDVTDVEYVGEAWVEGTWTDHVAARKPGADFELWVRKGPQPFLAKMVVVFTEDEGQPSYSARFRRWEATLPDSIDFDFTAPPGAERLDVAPVSQ